MSRSLRPLFRSTLVALSVVGSMGAAMAQGWTGSQPGTLSGYNPFSIVGTTVTVTKGANAFLTTGAFTNAQLLGIRGVWLIDPANPSQNGVTLGGAILGNGTVSNPGAATNWIVKDGGYTSAANGFPGNGNGTWIQLADTSVLNSFGIGNGTNFTQGSFLFTYANTPPAFALGIDYLIGAGGTIQVATGRVYFNGGTNNGGGGQNNGGGGIVPEPGEWAAMGIFATGLMGLVVRGRRRKA